MYGYGRSQDGAPGQQPEAQNLRKEAPDWIINLCSLTTKIFMWSFRWLTCVPILLNICHLRGNVDKNISLCDNYVEGHFLTRPGKLAWYGSAQKSFSGLGSKNSKLRGWSLWCLTVYQDFIYLDLNSYLHFYVGLFMCVCVRVCICVFRCHLISSLRIASESDMQLLTETEHDKIRQYKWT
jgi:hypothetical protein